MADWIEPGREPTLGDMFDDPIMRALMRSDGTDRETVEFLLFRAEAWPALLMPEHAA